MPGVDRPALRFTLLTYLFTWLLWLPALIQSLQGKEPAPWAIGIGIPGMMVPSVMGFIFLRREKTFREVLRELFRIRWSPWLLFSLLFLPAVVLLTHIVNVSLFDGTIPVINEPWKIPLLFITTLIAGGPLFEEIGWRGYLQGRLLKRFPILTTGFITGIAWGIWHLPLFLIRGMFHEHIPLDQFAITVVLMSIIICLVQVRAQNGIWPALFLHTFMNLTQEITPLFDELGHVLWTITNMVLAFSITIILLLGKSRKTAMPGVSR